MTGPSRETLLFQGDLGDLEPNADVGKFCLDWRDDTANAPFTILDFHDQTIRKSGRLLIETGGQFLLLDHNGPPVTQSADRAGNFAADLVEGPVRDVLTRFSSLRCLLPICSGTLHDRSAALVDDERKTHARARFRTLDTGKGTITLADIQALRGYDKAFHRLADRIATWGKKPLNLADSYRVLAPDTPSYEAKPTIALTQTESAFDVASDIVGTYLRVARQNEVGVIADLDTEFLHDYRVALRKTRSVVSLFKGVYSDTDTLALKTALAGLMAPTGRLRDLDVYLLERPFYFQLLPDTLHDGLATMFEAFETERAEELARLTERLKSPVYDNEINTLIDRFSTPGAIERGPRADLPAHEYAQHLIWKRYRKVCKIAATIDEDTPDEDVHELRINCKKLRYLMEFFAPLFPASEFKPILKPLKRLQDNLGLFNDYSVQQETLQTFMTTHRTGSRARDLSVAKSIGALIAILHQRQLQERARVMDNFAHFDSKAVRHSFRTLFRDKPKGGHAT